MHLHTGWAGQAASAWQAIYARRDGFAFQAGASLPARRGGPPPLEAGIVRARGPPRFPRLGNITRAQHARVFLRGLQGEPGAQLPILLKKVVDDGTHTGDWVPLKESPARLREVAPVRPALPRTNQSCSDCTESFPRMNAEFVIVMQPMRHPRRQPAGDVKSRY